MSLHPCPACRRHVVRAARVCPFCGAATAAPSAPVANAPRKLTRAAIFASSVLAVPGCWSSSAPTSTNPDDHHQHEAPPPDKLEPGTVTGTLTDGNGQPLASYQVTLDGLQQASAVTDEHGRFTFTNLPPGDYVVSLPSNHPRRQGPSQAVHLDAGAGASANLVYHVPTYDPNQIPMPYGAPPARLRVV